MTGTFDLGSYGAEIVINDSQFTDGMRNAENQINQVDGKAKIFGANLGTLAAGAVAGLGLALVGAMVAGVKATDELDKALNGLQASTGATDSEMKGMEESLKNIYSNNYGEDFKDIADSMALVKQNTGLAGKELEKTTQNALALRDTFELEVGETTNAANSLMKQFGISSEQAFNLIAQGAQNGANKNGDLIDSLNEYAPQFKAMGFSAEQFTNVLIDGAKNGAFSIDKVGDAVKEFNIRSKDGSDASAEGFKLLGLNAEQMTSKFAKGGDTAQAAFKQVMASLNSIEDPIKKNAAGVALFGTQFEDLEAGGIAALGNIGTTASLTNDALGKINEVKYDSFGDAMTGIGRNLQLGLLEPMQKYVLPLLSDFANWITDHLPQIQATMSTVFGTIGSAIGGVIDVVKSVISTFKDTESSSNSSFTKIKDNISSILNTLKGIITDIMSAIKVIWSKYGDDIMKYAKSSWENISKVISGVLQVIRGVVQVVTGLLTGDWDKALSGLKNIASGAFKAIEGIIKQSINAGKAVIDTTLTIIGNIFKTSLDGVLSTATTIFGKVKSALINPIESAKESISKIVDKIKNAFDFTWKLPDLKLPHVSVSMKKNSLGIPYPDFDVSWYAKGGIFDKASIVGLAENGREAILPLENPAALAPFADAITDRIIDKFRSPSNTTNHTNSHEYNYKIDVNIDNFHGTEKQINTLENRLVNTLKNLGKI